LPKSEWLVVNFLLLKLSDVTALTSGEPEESGPNLALFLSASAIELSY